MMKEEFSTVEYAVLFIGDSDVIAQSLGDEGGGDEGEG